MRTTAKIAIAMGTMLLLAHAFASPILGAGYKTPTYGTASKLDLAADLPRDSSGALLSAILRAQYGSGNYSSIEVSEFAETVANGGDVTEMAEDVADILDELTDNRGAWQITTHGSATGSITLLQFDVSEDASSTISAVINELVSEHGHTSANFGSAHHIVEQWKGLVVRSSFWQTSTDNSIAYLGICHGALAGFPASASLGTEDTCDSYTQDPPDLWAALGSGMSVTEAIAANTFDNELAGDGDITLAPRLTLDLFYEVHDTWQSFGFPANGTEATATVSDRTGVIEVQSSGYDEDYEYLTVVMRAIGTNYTNLNFDLVSTDGGRDWSTSTLGSCNPEQPKAPLVVALVEGPPTPFRKWNGEPPAYSNHKDCGDLEPPDTFPSTVDRTSSSKSVPIETDEAQLRALLEMNRSQYMNGWLASKRAAQAESWIAYCPQDWVEDVQRYVADFWAIAEGHNVSIFAIEPLEANPGGLRTGIEEHIAQQHSGSPVDGVFLVGAANEYYDTGSGQPERDIVPTYLITPESALAQDIDQEDPYLFSDWPYVDIDADGSPDIAICRWPVMDVPELLSVCLKMQSHNVRSEHRPPYSFSTLLLGGDYQYVGRDPEWVRSILSRNEDLALGYGVQAETILRSQYPTNRETTDAAVDAWNTNEPALTVMSSTGSDAYWPANFFNKRAPSYEFSMSEITSPSTGVVISMSCGTANYANTQDPLAGRTVGEDFLITAGRGAVAWVGPSWYQSWKPANDLLIGEMTERIYQDPSRSVAGVVFEATSQTLGNFSQLAELADTARALACLGDPFSSVEPRLVGTMPTSIELGTIGLSFDAASEVSTLDSVDPFNLFPFYAVVDATFADLGDSGRDQWDGLRAWEGQLQIDPGIVITSTTLSGQGMNVGAGTDNYVVGLADCLSIDGGQQVLATFYAMLVSPGQDLSIRLMPSVPSTFADGTGPSVPGWVACSDLSRYRSLATEPQEIITINPSGVPTDTLEPAIDFAKVLGIDGEEIEVTCSEGVVLPGTSSVQVVEESTGNPLGLTSVVVGKNAERFVIKLNAPTAPNELYTIKVLDLEDLVGNLNTGWQDTAAYDPRRPPNVEITEVFVYSTDKGHLKRDYFELKNMDSGPVLLEGWAVKDSNEEVHYFGDNGLPILIDGGGHAVICRDSQEMLAIGVLPQLELPDLSNSKNNGSLALYNEVGAVVSQIAWGTSWGRAREWNYAGDSSDPANWYESVVPLGTSDVGTPGRPNTTAPVAAEPHVQLTKTTVKGHPNPFNPIVNLEVQGSTGKRYSVRIYDLRGRLVVKLGSVTIPETGIGSMQWHGRDGSGDPVGSGVYNVAVLDGEWPIARTQVTLMK